MSGFGAMEALAHRLQTDVTRLTAERDEARKLLDEARSQEGALATMSAACDLDLAVVNKAVPNELSEARNLLDELCEIVTARGNWPGPGPASLNRDPTPRIEALLRERHAWKGWKR